jgi:hypothetical protein
MGGGWLPKWLALPISSGTPAGQHPCLDESDDLRPEESDSEPGAPARMTVLPPAGAPGAGLP